LSTDDSAPALPDRVEANPQPPCLHAPEAGNTERAAALQALTDGPSVPAREPRASPPTLRILHAGSPREGARPVDPSLMRPVSLGPNKGKSERARQYAQAIIQQRLKDLASDDIGRPVVYTNLPGTWQTAGGGVERRSREAGGKSRLDLVRLNVEKRLLKGGDGKEFVVPDVRTGRVPGVDPVTGKRDAARDAVHIYEITTMTDFVGGDPVMAEHKQTQLFNTLNQALNESAFPGAHVHYTIVSPGKPTQSTLEVIEHTISRIGGTKDTSRLTLRWMPIGIL
jgi:hypothetical protein